MPPPLRIVILLLLLGIAAGGALPAWSAVPDGAVCRLTVRWEQQPPYGVRLSDGVRSGYYAEAVREAARRSGCQARFVEMPWARGLRELEAGRLDVMPGALRTLGRERFARYTRPINLSPNLLFLESAAARRWPLADLEALSGTPLRVGIEVGAYYGPAYERLLDNPRFTARLHPMADRPRGWRMLREGRLDGIIADQASAFVEGLGLPKGRRLTPVLVVSAQPSHVMVGRHVDAVVAARLDAAFEAMVADGWLPTLRASWIPCEVDVATMGCRTGERIPAALPPPRAAGGQEGAGLNPR